MKYEWVIFDLDDTLIDFSRTERPTLIQTFNSYGIALDDKMIETYREINEGLWRQIENGVVDKEQVLVERFARFFDQYHIEADPASFNRDYLDGLGDNVYVFEETFTVLDALKPQVNLAILTNGEQKTQHKKLKKAGLIRYFDAIVTSDEAGFTKPNVGIFDYLFEIVGGFEKSSTLMVGDSLSADITGGNAYGIDTCWYNPKGNPNVAGIESNYEIRHLEELMGILEKGKDIR